MYTIMKAGELFVGAKIRSTFGLLYTVTSVDTMSRGRVKVRLIGKLPWTLVLHRDERVNVI